MSHDSTDPDRRRLLRLALAAPIVFAAGARLRWFEADPADAAAKSDPAAPRLEATPACDDGDDPTPAMTAGPFFTPNSPLRASLLEKGMAGTRLVVTGQVYSVGCKPVANALIDVWQADDEGEYDNDGYRLRGHQFTAADGSYRLETIVPGRYPGRTPHIHVRVQPKGGRILTTQLFFPEDKGNARDFLFRPELLMGMRDAKDGRGREGRFHFVLASASS